MSNRRIVAGYELSACAAPEGISSFQQVEERSNALANALLRRGVKPGAHLVTWLPNSSLLAETFFALEKIGGVRVAVEWNEPAPKVVRIVSALQATHVFVPAESVTIIRTLLPPATTVIACGPWPLDTRHDNGVIPYDDLLQEGHPEFPGIEICEDNPIRVTVRMAAGDEMIQVTQSYRNASAMLRLQLLLYGGGFFGPPLTGDEVYLHVQQLMYGTGRMGLYPMFLSGFPQVILTRFHAPSALRAIEKHRVTTVFMVPGMVERIVQALDEGVYDISSLRRLLYGGAPLSRGSLLRATHRLGDAMIQVYGRHGAVWPVSVLTPIDHHRIQAGDDRLSSSCGRPLPLVEFRLADHSGRMVELGAVGEIQVRSDTVAAGYADESGWCGTTDLAFQDEEGYLYIVGRTDDMINTGSYHVYPGEIEEVLRSHATVADACVIGIPDPSWGEAVKACVVLKPGQQPQDELRQGLLLLCREMLSVQKVPKCLEFLESF
ncbi:MAG: AMP-binding protein, partial [Betaproteobacteria bacterium]|nr:AMP-binding protein [Betaproteobacteria bacterium]